MCCSMDRPALGRQHLLRLLPMKWGLISAKHLLLPSSARGISLLCLRTCRRMTSFLSTKFTASLIMSRRFSTLQWRIMPLISSLGRGLVHALCVWILHHSPSLAQRPKQERFLRRCAIGLASSHGWNIIRRKHCCSSLNEQLRFFLSISNARGRWRLLGVRAEHLVLRTAS